MDYPTFQQSINEASDLAAEREQQRALDLGSQESIRARQNSKPIQYQWNGQKPFETSMFTRPDRTETFFREIDRDRDY
ncbi:hypothetical protein IT409_01200 [Candidatus Falkowbacteria bacterium]|nr:hypothetical protein [Candidatus Falkowbacteria bacterium]